MQLTEMRAIVSGRVQGVGFRATARGIARQIGVAGSAKNLPDGKVEIYAQGSKEQLDQFILVLKEEFGSCIRSIEQEFYEAGSAKEGFSIK